jgi:hypothetical protein
MTFFRMSAENPPIVGTSQKCDFGLACKLLIGLEAAVGIEPTDKGFADLCLTTWLRRPE